MQSDKRNTVTCSAALGALINTPCYGFCRPEARSVVSAQFSNDGRRILITLNSEASPISMPCSSILDGNSSSLLGPNAWCDAQERSLAVTLQPTSSIKPGNRINLNSAQTVLVDMLVPNATFTGSVTIRTCEACQQPALVVTGPQVRIVRILLITNPAPCAPSL